LSYDVTATLPKVARYGNEARLDADRETPHRCRHSRRSRRLVFPSPYGNYPLLVSIRPVFPLLRRDKALFQDFRALLAQDRRHVSFANRRSEVDPLTVELIGGWRVRRVCTESRRLYFPRHVPVKPWHFSRIFNRWERRPPRFWRSPTKRTDRGGFPRSDYDIRPNKWLNDITRGVYFHFLSHPRRDVSSFPPRSTNVSRPRQARRVTSRVIKEK